MPPKYVERFARLPEVFAMLAVHPDGLPLADVAERLGIPAGELRADLLAFFTADLGGLLGLTRPSVMEFLGADGSDADPNQAEIVRIVDERPAEELGVEYVDAASLGLVYNAALALAEAEPDNEDLLGALNAIAETMLGQGVSAAEPPVANDALGPLQEAARERHRVGITYSRAWREGVIDRVVDPYLLVQTRRGWELDAGPPDDEGRLRTFLLSNIRSVEVLGEKFEPPADLSTRLVAQRTTRTVQVRLPHTARWVGDMYAEHVHVVEDNETDVVLDLELLEPVERRLGLLLLVAGPDAVVISPPGLVRAVGVVAGELLAHHRG
jgi:proteasome accessory factor C